MTSDVITVALPVGLGDTHWAVQKIRALKEFHNGAKIRAIINTDFAHVTVNYLKLIPFIDEAVQSKQAPLRITQEMKPSYKDPKWSTLDGCRGWKDGVDYLLVPNGHLENGLRIEEYLPELETDYTYPLNVSDEDKKYVDRLTYNDDKPLLIYMSGENPNKGFHNNTWTINDWADLINLINIKGYRPYLMGANYDDIKYYNRFNDKYALSGIDYISILGETTTSQACYLIQRASCWVGLNSGLGIIAASQETPTVMFWSNTDYACRVKGIKPYLPPEMQTSWLCEGQLKMYNPVSYGHPDLCPELVVSNIMDVIR